MAGSYTPGEKKVRPNAYYHIGKKGTGSTAGAVNGVTAVLFRADFGPLNTAYEMSSDENYEDVFGSALTTDAIAQAIAGGAKTIIAVRVGSGGTAATLDLKDTGSFTAVVTLTAKYPGAKALTCTVRKTLADETIKECIIYSGTKQVEKVEFAAGAGEAGALAEAFANSNNFIATVKSGQQSKELADVSQTLFTAGTNPTVNNAAYSDALEQTEPFEINTLCVDTEDNAVHLLVQSFMSRMMDVGSLMTAVVAEKKSVDLDTRMTHAAAFNDERMMYVLNASAMYGSTELDGYQTAARLAGMIGSVASSSSLTHTVISGFSGLGEPLSNTKIIKAEQSGCIVLSANKSGQVWIDNAINTLVTPPADRDDGWKKIRRTKTRYELIRRCNTTNDNMVGKVDNDNAGRAAIIGALQSIVDEMVAESKLVSGTVSLNPAYSPNGDSAWFIIDIVDKDSAEHFYTDFLFRFETTDSE